MKIVTVICRPSALIGGKKKLGHVGGLGKEFRSLDQGEEDARRRRRRRMDERRSAHSRTLIPFPNSNYVNPKTNCENVGPHPCFTPKPKRILMHPPFLVIWFGPPWNPLAHVFCLFTPPLILDTSLSIYFV